MTHSIEGSIAEILSKGGAQPHERWIDDYDNVWEIREDRDGLILHAVDGNASISYWTTCVVRLPGLRRV